MRVAPAPRWRPGRRAMGIPAGIAVWVAATFLVLGLITTCLLVALAAASAGRLLTRRTTIGALLPGQRWLVGALGLLLAWLSLSLLWARDPGMAWSNLGLWCLAGVVLVLVSATIERPESVKLVVVGFVIGALASVIIGAAEGSASSLAGRFAGTEGDPNGLAAALVPAGVLAAALLADAGGWVVRGTWAGIVAVLAIGLAATHSRGGFLAAGVLLPVLPFVFRRHQRRLWGLVALAVCLAGTWYALSPGALRQEAGLRDGGDGRSTLWLVAWRMAKDSTPEGVGLNNFRVASPGYENRPGALRYVEQIDHAHVVHNTYLQLLAETGIVGLSLFLAVVAACLGAAHRAAAWFERSGRGALANLARAVMLAGFAGSVAQVFLSNGYDPRYWFLLALGPALWGIALRSDPARS
ncbi:MAG: O-antigen ligase family protein [Solirubrobacteraceae bacterium]